MKQCRQCGKELPDTWSTDICLECSKANVQKIFQQHPEVKQAFKESVEEMKKPENMKRMVNNTVQFMQKVQQLQANSKDKR